MSKINKVTLAESIKTGGITVLVFLVIQNGVSFLSQLILARLVAPDDFGVVAMAMLFGMFFQNIFNTQGDKFIIKKKKNQLEILNVIISFELVSFRVLRFRHLFLSFGNQFALTASWKLFLIFGYRLPLNLFYFRGGRRS